MSRWALASVLLSTLLVGGGRPAPVPPAKRPVIEVVFCVDTTRDMEAALAALKGELSAICDGCRQGRPSAVLRVGLVAYRDRGDEYVTRRVPLTDNLDGAHQFLKGLAADGGGDAPEAVNLALHEAIYLVNWSPEAGANRHVVLIGSAPPHDDYDDDIPYPTTCAAAAARGIAIHTVLVGNDAACSACWQQIATRAQGRFFADLEGALRGGIARAIAGSRNKPR